MTSESRRTEADELLFEALVVGERSSDEPEVLDLLLRRSDLQHRLERILATQALLGSAFEEERDVLAEAASAEGGPSSIDAEAMVSRAMAARGTDSRAKETDAAGERSASFPRRGRPWTRGLVAVIALAAAALVVYVGLELLRTDESGPTPGEGGGPVLLGVGDGAVDMALQAAWQPDDGDLRVSWNFSDATVWTEFSLLLIDPEKPEVELDRVMLKRARNVATLRPAETAQWPSDSLLLLEARTLEEAPVYSLLVPLPSR